MFAIHYILAAALHALPQGYVIDCRSCPNNVPRVNLVVHLVAKDGTRFTTGRMNLVPKAGVARITLIAAIGDSDFVVRRGDNDTVIVFGPKGQSMKSITFEWDQWQPVYRRYYGK